jgi:hypothetical protein
MRQLETDTVEFRIQVSDRGRNGKARITAANLLQPYGSNAVSTTYLYCSGQRSKQLEVDTLQRNEERYT